MSEDDFIDACIEGFKELIPEVENLEYTSLEKLNIETKLFELCFWFKQYKYEKQKDEEGSNE